MGVDTRKLALEYFIKQDARIMRNFLDNEHLLKEHRGWFVYKIKRDGGFTLPNGEFLDAEEARGLFIEAARFNEDCLVNGDDDDTVNDENDTEEGDGYDLIRALDEECPDDPEEDDEEEIEEELNLHIDEDNEDCIDLNEDDDNGVYSEEPNRILALCCSGLAKGEKPIIKPIKNVNIIQQGIEPGSARQVIPVSDEPRASEYLQSVQNEIGSSTPRIPEIPPNATWYTANFIQQELDCVNHMFDYVQIMYRPYFKDIINTIVYDIDKVCIPEIYRNEIDYNFDLHGEHPAPEDNEEARIDLSSLYTMCDRLLAHRFAYIQNREIKKMANNPDYKSPFAIETVEERRCQAQYSMLRAMAKEQGYDFDMETGKLIKNDTKETMNNPSSDQSVKSNSSKDIIQTTMANNNQVYGEAVAVKSSDSRKSSNQSAVDEYDQNGIRKAPPGYVRSNRVNDESYTGWVERDRLSIEAERQAMGSPFAINPDTGRRYVDEQLEPIELDDDDYDEDDDYEDGRKRRKKAKEKRIREIPMPSIGEELLDVDKMMGTCADKYLDEEAMRKREMFLNMTDEDRRRQCRLMHLSLKNRYNETHDQLVKALTVGNSRLVSSLTEALDQINRRLRVLEIEGNFSRDDMSTEDAKDEIRIMYSLDPEKERAKIAEEKRREKIRQTEEMRREETEQEDEKPEKKKKKDRGFWGNIRHGIKKGFKKVGKWFNRNINTIMAITVPTISLIAMIKYPPIYGTDVQAQKVEPITPFSPT